MKIAMICSTGGWGGLEQNTVKTSIWLKEAGIDITIICEEGSRITQSATEAGLPVILFQQKGKHRVLGQARKLAHIIKVHNIEALVIAHGRHLYLSGWAKYYLKNKLKLLYWQHMQMPVYRKDWYHASFYRKIDKWITPLDYLRTELKRTTTLRPTQITQIPQVINTQAFTNIKDLKISACKKYDIPPDIFTVGTIGRIDSQKGQEFLIQAMRILKQKKLPIQAIIMGANDPKDYLGYLQGLAKELAVEDSILFLPFSDHIQEGFAMLDVFIMCSLSEPIGMVTVEAMTAQIPVVGTDAGGTPELLEHGEVGLLVPPKEPEALAKAIEYLYKNPEKAKEMAGKAHKTALQKYDIPVQVKAFKKVFNEL